jgi:acyl carrier protein
MRDKIKSVMKTVLEIGEVPDNISTQNCPQWDSLHHLSLVIELESLYNVSFEPDEIAKMKSLKVIEEVLGTKIKK